MGNCDVAELYHSVMGLVEVSVDGPGRPASQGIDQSSIDSTSSAQYPVYAYRSRRGRIIRHAVKRCLDLEACPFGNTCDFIDFVRALNVVFAEYSRPRVNLEDRVMETGYFIETALSHVRDRPDASSVLKEIGIFD